MDDPLKQALTSLTSIAKHEISSANCEARGRFTQEYAMVSSLRPESPARDASLGAELIASGADFKHDCDIIVPQERQGNHRVALAFDSDILFERAPALTDVLKEPEDISILCAPAARRQLPLLQVPEAHARSAKAMLQSLLPPAEPCTLPLPDALDVLDFAHLMGADEECLEVCEATCAAALQEVTPADMVEALKRCKNNTRGRALDTAVKLLRDNPDARASVVDLEAEDLAEILQQPGFAVPEDIVFSLAEQWSAARAHDDVPIAAVMRKNGLHRVVRWHELSQALFSRVSRQGFLSPKEFREVLMHRPMRRGTEIRVETLDITHRPRDASSAPGRQMQKRLQEAIRVAHRQSLKAVMESASKLIYHGDGAGARLILTEFAQGGASRQVAELDLALANIKGTASDAWWEEMCATAPDLHFTLQEAETLSRKLRDELPPQSDTLYVEKLFKQITDDLLERYARRRLVMD